MKTMLAYASLLAAALTAPAAAQNLAPPRHSLSVSYSDLDLHTDAGVRILDQRLRNAVSNACGIPSSADRYGKKKIETCRTEARKEAHAHRTTAIASARSSDRTRLAATD